MLDTQVSEEYGPQDEDTMVNALRSTRQALKEVTQELARMALYAVPPKEYGHFVRIRGCLQEHQRKLSVMATELDQLIKLTREERPKWTISE